MNQIVDPNEKNYQLFFRKNMQTSIKRRAFQRFFTQMRYTNHFNTNDFYHREQVGRFGFSDDLIIR